MDVVRRVHPLLLVPPALVVALAFDQGGFDPSAWVWAGALAAWAAATAAVAWRELHLSEPRGRGSRRRAHCLHGWACRGCGPTGERRRSSSSGAPPCTRPWCSRWSCLYGAALRSTSSSSPTWRSSRSSSTRSRTTSPRHEPSTRSRGRSSRSRSATRTHSPHSRQSASSSASGSPPALGSHGRARLSRPPSLCSRPPSH